MNRPLLACCLLLVALMVPLRTALAEGPGTGGRAIRLDDEPAGPYRLRVVTSPTPPRVGSLFVEIRVIDHATDELVRDASVQVSAEPTEGNAPPLQSSATHDFAPIPGEYAAHLPVSEAGIWEIRIAIEGTQGAGEAAFLQRVSSQSSLGAAVSILLPIGGLVALGIAFLWLQRTRGASDLTTTSASRPRESRVESGDG